MPNVNINSGAAGNPLDALLAGRPIWGTIGGVGVGLSAGYTSESGDTIYGPGYIGPNDPRNAQMVQALSNYNGKGPYSQVRDTNIGGPGEIIDPSQAIYDPTYGLIAPSGNFKPMGTDIGDWGPFALAAIPAIAIAGGALAGAGASGSGAAAAEVGASGVGAGGVGAGVGGTAAAEGGGGLLSSLGLSGGGTGAAGGGGFLSTLNTARSGLGLISALMGGGGGGTTGGGNMGALGSIMSLLGLGALGRQGGLFGGGVGTPGGAQGVADRASAMADPWGTSGLRGQAQQALTPGTMMQLLGLNPGGTASDITKDPAYQFALTQGTNAINVGDAAQGTLRSGNRLAELQNYGTGLAAQYENQYRNQNLASLGALSNMAGLSSSSPTAAAASQISGFEGATSLQNSGLNGLFGNLLGGGPGGGGLGNIMSGLGSGFSQIFGTNGWLSQMFGDNSGLSDSAISDLISGIGGGNTSDDLFGAFGDALAGP